MVCSVANSLFWLSLIHNLPNVEQKYIKIDHHLLLLKTPTRKFVPEILFPNTRMYNSNCHRHHSTEILDPPLIPPVIAGKAVEQLPASGKINKHIALKIGFRSSYKGKKRCKSRSTILTSLV